jgi:NAD(P)-dependent dehydrogenase (short-subunit alcohol dehydrogenase family)
MIELAGSGAIITGAGRRLGRAFAEYLLQSGVDVIVHYGQSSEGAEQVTSSAAGWPGRAVSLQADLADPEQAINLIQESFDELTNLKFLINNAAIFEPVGVHDASIESWQSHLAINLTAPFILSREFARLLGGAEGVIVNMLDWRADRPGADHFPYTISKAALAAVTKSMAQAFAPNIRVNGLALGAILPPSGGAEGDPLEGVPSGRWGTVEETIHALRFLLSRASYTTGEILSVDGGRHLI